MENPNDTQFKQCPECLGIGHDETSVCCGAKVSPNNQVCQDCKDFCDYTPCQTCNGDGEVAMTEEEIREEENENELEAGDNKMDLED